MAFKFGVKKCSLPNLCFREVLLVNWLQSGNIFFIFYFKAWQACAQQTEKIYYHTNSAVTRQVYVDAPLVQHLYSVFFQYMV